jgi:hypothetical protein
VYTHRSFIIGGPCRILSLEAYMVCSGQQLNDQTELFGEQRLTARARWVMPWDGGAKRGVELELADTQPAQYNPIDQLCLASVLAHK